MTRQISRASRDCLYAHWLAHQQWTRLKEGAMKSPVVKRSIVLAGHKTSVSLEDAFWEGLKEIAKAQRKTLSDLVNSIDIDREQANLSSAIRLFVLNHYQVRHQSDDRPLGRAA
jgi:predicted DNA-binding ribbon-helix-helix protein